MRFYNILDKIFPGSYVAKFGLVLALAISCPVLMVLLVAPGSKVDISIFGAIALIGWLVALRAVLGLLSPLAQLSASLQRTEAGHHARPLPTGYRDEVGQLMECANRLAGSLATQVARAAEAADKDSMTGLLNRRGLERRMPLVQAGAIVIIDVDNFKEVNDRYGHHVGDRLLIQVADLLTATVRERDLLARIGGEEFLLCLPGAGQEQARLAAERVRIAFEDRIQIEGSSVTASIGVACGQRGDALWKVVEAADHAMLEAKTAGRNRVVCAATDAKKSAAAKAGETIPAVPLSRT